MLSAGFTTLMAITILITTAQTAKAGVTLKDVQTIVRTIGFLENAPSSESVMAIIYNPDSTESLQNARQMEDLIKSEKKDIEPRLVAVSNMTKIQGADFVFVTDGLQSHYDSIKAALKNSKALSFTLDRACVIQNCCAVYINSKNRVEIVVNKTAADTIETRFKPVFLMMVTVI